MPVSKNLDEVVVSGSIDIDGTLNIGGSSVTATATELNILDGATVSTTELNILDGVTSTSGEVENVTNVGDRIVDITESTAITAATHGERIMALDSTSFSLATLPAATGTGNRYTFYIKTVNTSTWWIIGADSSDKFFGQALMAQDGGDTSVLFNTGASSGVVILNGTTQGGAAVGDRVELIDIATDHWSVMCYLTGTGTEVTPFGNV